MMSLVDEIPAELRGLSAERIGLFLDVDGTILDLAEHPDSVEVPERLVAHLAGAERRCAGALALVSGRPIAALDRLFAPVRLRASGIHGAEIRLSPDGACQTLIDGSMPEASWQALTALLVAFPGTFAENKGVSFAVHHSVLDDAGEAALSAALAQFMVAWAPLDLEMVRARRVFEIKVAGFDKGRAIDRFMVAAPFAGRIPVFVADDPADRPGFEAVLARGGMALSVGIQTQGLSGSFSGPAAVRAWLAEIGG
jgi:trehalose 6-phosphate phosphatase